jgi:phosphoglycolate phosphatase
MNEPQIIWDWNGTILNDVPHCVAVMNALLTERGLNPISSEGEYRDLFCFPVSCYYEKLGFDFQSEPFETLARLYMNRYCSAVRTCALRSGVKDVLQKLKEQGKRQIILSASESGALREQVSYFGITHFFDAVLGLDNHYAASKTELARGYFGRLEADRKSVLLIGDTVHDYEVAKALGCTCLLIADGHQAQSSLQATGAGVLSDIRDVLDYVNL